VFKLCGKRCFQSQIHVNTTSSNYILLVYLHINVYVSTALHAQIGQSPCLWRREQPSGGRFTRFRKRY